MVSMSDHHSPNILMQQLSIKGKLYLALGTITALTAILGITSWLTFSGLQKNFKQVTEEHIKELEVASSLKLQAVRFSAKAPLLFSVRDEKQLSTLSEDLQKSLTEEIGSIKILENAENTSSAIAELNDALATQLHNVTMQKAKLLALDDMQVNNEKIIIRTQSDITSIITPLIDDTFFELIVGVDKNLKNENRKWLHQQIKTLSVLREIRSDTNLLVGLLETGLNYQDISGFPPLEEIYKSTANDLRRQFSYLDSLDTTKYSKLHE